MLGSKKNSTNNEKKQVRKSRRLGIVKIVRASLSFYKQNFIKLSSVASIVLLSSSVVKAYDQNSSTNSDIVLILYVAGLFALVALIWVCFNAEKVKRVPLSQIYVSSSARFLPLLLVSIAQTLMSLLAIVGGFVFLLATAAGLGWWLAVIGGVMILLSIWLLVRYSLAGLLVVGESVSGRTALKRSRELTKKFFWRLLGSYVGFVIVIGFSCGLVLEIFVRLPVLSKIWFFQGLVNGILLSIVVPLMVIFGYQLYQVLDEKRSS